MIISGRFKQQNNSTTKKSYRGGQLEEINSVKAKMKSGDLSLHETTCPCGGSDFGVIASIERYGISLETVLCDSCGSLRFKEYFTDYSLSEFYITHYQEMYGRLGNIPEYFGRQQTYGKRIYKTYEDMLSKEDNVLEIGCGAGGGLAYFKHQGLSVFGCEYSKTLVDYANEAGLNQVFHGSLFDIEEFIPNKIKFKLIYIHHVFEHVNDPISLLKICRSLLADDGRLVVGVPDFLEIDKFANPGCDLLPFLHVAHKYNFTSDCFATMANQVKFGYKNLELDESLSTPWAVQPELWGEFKKTSKAISQDNSKTQKVGEQVWKYLKSTENDFISGVCYGKKHEIKRGFLKLKLMKFFSRYKRA